MQPANKKNQLKVGAEGHPVSLVKLGQCSMGYQESPRSLHHNLRFDVGASLEIQIQSPHILNMWAFNLYDWEGQYLNYPQCQFIYD